MAKDKKQREPRPRPKYDPSCLKNVEGFCMLGAKDPVVLKNGEPWTADDATDGEEE